VGFWPTQLSLSILSRNDFTVPLPAARQTPNLEDQLLERSNSRHRRALVAEGGTMGEKWPRILPKVATSMSLLGSFTCRKVTIWDRRLYFPSEGKRAEDFFRPKNPTASAGFEPAGRQVRSLIIIPTKEYLHKSVYLLCISHLIVMPTLLSGRRD
jgi:hypothetical protein